MATAIQTISGEIQSQPLNDNFSYVNAELISHDTQFSDIINVKHPPSPLTGATGDGITDDSTAINNILSNYPRVYFPPSNTFYCESPITVNDDNNIIGGGISTVFRFSTGINGFEGSGAISNVFMANFKIQGTNVLNANENGIEFIGHSTSGFPKLIIENLQISDFGNIGVYLENCFDCSLQNVHSSGNKSHGFQIISCFAASFGKIVAYQNQGHGTYIQSSAGSLFTGDCQENYKNGLLVETSKGCTFEFYLEQNGWNTVTDNEKAQFRLTQRAGGYKPSSGNSITIYALGGKGSVSPTYESKYGIYIDFGLENEVNGNFGGHLTSDIYLTSNSSNNKLNVVEYETGLVGGDTPTPLTNNGTMNGYSIISQNKNSRIETLSYASQTAARSITFAKAFSVAPKMVGTVVGSTSVTDMTVKINNITTTGFDFVVTDGAAYVNAALVNFIAIGE